MTTSNTSKLKRVMCGLLSTLTVLSGTAVAGTAVTTTAFAAEVTTETSAAKTSEVTPATFSWDNATVYFLLTDRFKNGDTSNDNAYHRQEINVGDTRATFHGGDFAGITEKINEGYFNDLGVNAIWLTAPYEQIHGYIQGGSNFYHYSYHGYYVLDYTQTDKAYGTEEEFRELVDTAHKNGIRIIMDVVMNHAGYCSMYDMNEYNFGGLVSGWENFYQNPPSNAQTYQSYMDYENQADKWAKWWGPDWIRSSVAGYSEGEGGSELTQCLSGLPDFKTESTASLSLPPILQTKWSMEGTLAQKQAKYGSSGTVTDYITKWLSEWVREYGVDGFRCDTAKHVEKSSWKKLKTACVAALKEWKSNNPDKALDDLDFWMTGEHWDHGLGKDDYYTAGGFDSMINFDMTGGTALSIDRVSGKYNDYATAINNDDSFNALTFISSHDETLARSDDMFYLGSAFLMLPGAVQIYYGDETARPYVSGIPQDGYGGAGHSLRSDMNWDSYDPELLAHWGKVGNFRNNHIAVGGGANVTLTATSGVAFGRTYSKNGLEDKVAGVIGATANADVTVDVSAIWDDGTLLENFYDDSVAVVSGGKVTFNAGAHGTILIQEPDGERGRVTVTHIDQDSGKTMKTQTLVGLLGESYTATPLDTLGYKLTKTTGSKTGTFSETEGSVTFYYSFDSSNYAHIEIQYVDSETGAAIAESDSQVGKIGSSYTTEAKSIKNYEVDTVPSNAAGTVKSGTTTVTYKYVYVEPSNLQVHYYNANSWSAVNLYAYTEVGSVATEYTGKWPGKSMTSEGDGWFYCDVPDTESGLVIFNNGGTAQEPGQKQPGYDATGEVWVKSGKVYPTGKVNVKYVGTDGKVLGTDIVKGMADGTTKYSTSAKTFSGYKLSSTPSNAAGTFSENTVTVTYTYTPDTPVNELKNSSTVSSTAVKVGDTVTITGKATGGTSPYQYAFYYKRGNATSWTTKASYGTATSVELTPAYADTYTVRVDVKDNNGTVVSKTFTITSSEKVTTLVNNSTVSSTSVKKGETVTITGKASGGTGSYQYAFYYKRGDATSWTTKSAYGKATSVELTPAYVDTYTVRVDVKDSNGTVTSKTFTITSSSETPLTNNSTSSATSVTVGKSVTITGAAEGGSGSYQYAFYYKRGDAASWTTKSAYGKATSVTLSPAYADTYYVMVNVKDSAGTVKSKIITITSKNVTLLTNNSTISAATVTLGNTITITGNASGGTAPYQYAFYYTRGTGTGLTTISAYGKATSAEFKPVYADIYTIRVAVKDNNNTVVYKTFRVRSSSALTNNSTISATSVKKGTEVTITGKSSNGIGTVKYAFYYKKSGESSWKTKSDYGKATSVTLTPAYVDTYTIQVDAKDSTGTVASKTLTLTSTGTLTNNSTISATSVKKGTAVTITGKSSGGTGTVQYAFYYKKSGESSWITKSAYGKATSVTLTPGYVTTYTIRVDAKDSTGTVASKTFTLTSTSTLANNSTVSATAVTVGKTVTITGKSSGGTGTVQYAFYYKRGSATSWTTKSAYGKATSVELTPAYADTYTVKVDAKDSSGTVVSKTFTIKSSQPTALVNNSSLSSASVTKGTTVTIKGAASGGTGSYTYAYYYKKSDSSQWIVKGTEFGTATSVTLTPGTAINYDVKVVVRDSSGETVTKTFTIIVK